MLDLADVVELIDDRLNEGARAQEPFISDGEQAIVHVLAPLGDEAPALGDEQLRGELLGDVAAVANERADETSNQTGHWTAIIHVARRQAARQQFPLIVNDQMEFEAVEPADRGLATSCVEGEDAMVADAGILADGERRRVDTADPRAGAELRVELDDERRQHRGQALHEAQRE
jgi:hypothetical protein